MTYLQHVTFYRLTAISLFWDVGIADGQNRITLGKTFCPSAIPNSLESQELRVTSFFTTSQLYTSYWLREKADGQMDFDHFEIYNLGNSVTDNP